MTAPLFVLFVLRFRRGIAWMIAWLIAFWVPAFIPIVGWVAPILLGWFGGRVLARRGDPRPRPLHAPLTQWNRR